MTTGWLLPPARRGVAAGPELVALRESLPGDVELRPAAVAIHETRIGGVRCLECVGPDHGQVILYLHGGAYRRGHPEMAVSFAARLAHEASARIVIPDYRLAPENPFPAALHDAAAVYSGLVVAGGEQPIVGGDSAGGGLCLSLTAAAIHSQQDPPSAVFAICPWTDLTLSARSYLSRAATDQVFSATTASEAAQQYLQGHDPRDPLASPAFADLSNFPPACFMVSSEEVLLDDTLEFCARLARASRAVQLHVVPGMQHDWPILDPLAAESHRAVSRVARFVIGLRDDRGADLQ
jgi:monoterpene epsilon-lactone hydrolase